MACCKDVTFTVSQHACPFAVDSTDVLSLASPDCPNRPGSFMSTHTIHVPANTFVNVQEIGLTFDDTYLFLVDSLGNVVAESDDSPMGLSSQLDVLIEVEGDYTIQSTTFAAGQTGTIRVKCGCDLLLPWCPDQGHNFDVKAPNTVLPITWTTIGTLPPTFSFIVTFDPHIASFVGQTNPNTDCGNYSFQLKAVDGNGKVTIQNVVVEILGVTNAVYDTVPPPLVAPQVVVTKDYPFSLQLNPVGGTGSGYNFQVPPGGLPPGLSLTSGGLISGTPTATGPPPASSGILLNDSGANQCTVGISWCYCVGAINIADATEANGYWEVNSAFTNPPGDSGSWTLIGGSATVDCDSVYLGGPCSSHQSLVTVFLHICRPSATPYTIHVVMDVSGSYATNPLCANDGSSAWTLSFTGYAPYNNSVGGIGPPPVGPPFNVPYSDHQEFDYLVTQCGTLLTFSMATHTATLHGTLTITPVMAPP